MPCAIPERTCSMWSATREVAFFMIFTESIIGELSQGTSSVLLLAPLPLA